MARTIRNELPWLRDDQKKAARSDDPARYQPSDGGFRQWFWYRSPGWHWACGTWRIISLQHAARRTPKPTWWSTKSSSMTASQPFWSHCHRIAELVFKGHSLQDGPAIPIPCPPEALIARCWLRLAIAMKSWELCHPLQQPGTAHTIAWHIGIAALGSRRPPVVPMGCLLLPAHLQSLD